MITKVSKNVICVKDIPSNLIEEAIFILRTNSNEVTNKIQTKRGKDFLMKEAENIIIEYNDKFQNEYNRKKRIEEKKKKMKEKDIKLKAIVVSILFIVLCMIISCFIK